MVHRMIFPTFLTYCVLNNLRIARNVFVWLEREAMTKGSLRNEFSRNLSAKPIDRSAGFDCERIIVLCKQTREGRVETPNVNIINLVCHVYSVWNVPVQKKSVLYVTQHKNQMGHDGREKKNRRLEVCSQTWSSSDEFLGLTFGCQILFSHCWGRMKKKGSKYDNDCCNLSRRLSGGRSDTWSPSSISASWCLFFICSARVLFFPFVFAIERRSAKVRVTIKATAPFPMDYCVSEQEAPRARWW